MKKIQTKFLLQFYYLIFFIGTTNAVFAQDTNQKSFQASLGIATTILDSSLGFSLATNGHVPLNSYFGFEGQVSYNYSKISSSFISGRRGHSNTLNALVGLRLYFNPKDAYKFYINGLVGASYNKEKLNGLSLDPEFIGGISLGAYMDFNHKYVLGLALESPEFLVLRFGYIF